MMVGVVRGAVVRHRVAVVGADVHAAMAVGGNVRIRGSPFVLLIRHDGRNDNAIE